MPRSGGLPLTVTIRAANAQNHEAIRYLEWCVRHQDNKDPAIHNYLISLYAKLQDDTPLMSFLQRQGEDPIYDLKYALRLCTQEKRRRACVAIYSAMELYVSCLVGP